jgi:transaldolase / glucose-6-phosphate isomerase
LASFPIHQTGHTGDFGSHAYFTNLLSMTVWRQNMATLRDIHQSGQSTWLNYLRNSFIRSGELTQHIERGIQGITANALVYQRAIGAGGDYDDAIRRETAAGTPARRIHEALVVDDLQRAADVLRPIFDESNRLDGFVSLELEPALLTDAIATVAEVRRLSHHIDRYNVMVEIPATPAGIEAIRHLVADGVSVNATHIFSVAVYEQVAQAYIDGLEKYITSHSVWRVTPTAVASFSLSPIDAAVDPLLLEAGRNEMTGRTALAMAKVLYQRFQNIFAGPRWEKLADRGGRVLRPKWTRMTPRNFLLPTTYYLESLIYPSTIATLSPQILNAFVNMGSLAVNPTEGFKEAQTHLADLVNLDIDLDKISTRLQKEHLQSSDRQFHDLIQVVMRRRDELDRGWEPMATRLGDYGNIITEGLDELSHQRVVCRIWNHDHTLWKPDPAEITNRLGWLHIMDALQANTTRLQSFTTGVLDEGFTHALLLGMGGSSLAPELYYNTFGRPSRPANMPFEGLDLVVLDTTDADSVSAVDESLDLSHTLVIVATKSGSTIETLSAFKYYYNRLAALVGADKAGEHIIGITDPGSKIVELADQYRFRDLFLNDPNIGGRYSALSYFGLVPAALVGVDLSELLERGSATAANAMLCDRDMIDQNLSARLGAILGRLGLAGRDKLTFITSAPIATFGDWAEQLIAESLGKEGKGILPVVGERIAEDGLYGDDRLFVHLRLDGDRTQDAAVPKLADAGHPVVTLRLKDVYDIGGQFLLWEMATAIAAYFMAINPFDQPDVEAAKGKAREIVAEYSATGQLPNGDLVEPEASALAEFLSKVQPGDYIAIQAYAQKTAELDEALQRLREKIRSATATRLGYYPATSIGYGPRFLHSTGQLHKGDSGNGLFVQLVSDAMNDVAIPDQAGAAVSSISFNILKKAQALGDARALRDARRRVIAFDAGQDPVNAVRSLAGGI